jgi:hypothetical protein
MSEPEQVDLSAETDGLVQRTDNGWKPDDPADQPPQTPTPLTGEDA